MCKLPATFVQLIGMWNCVFHSCLTLHSEARFTDLLTWILSIIQHMQDGCSTELPLCLSILSYSFVSLSVLEGIQAFVTHEHASRKKAWCIWLIFTMAALGLASFALIHLGDGFFVKAGVLVASCCIYLHSPIFSMLPWCIQINCQHLPDGIASTLTHPLTTSRYIFVCHKISFRFPKAGPASHVFDLSWHCHMCRCLGRATKVWRRVAGLEQQMLACPGRRVNQAKQLRSDKDEAIVTSDE